MMTHKEQEEKVYSEFLNVKKDFETLLERKITRKNFKKAIVDATRIAVKDQDHFNKAEKEKDNIAAFFKKCETYLGEVIWSEIKEKNIKINILYQDTALLSWNVPVDVFFDGEEQYELGMKVLLSSFSEAMFSFFLTPSLREAVIKNDPAAIRHLYSSFNRPSMNSSLVNLKMLKECFPDFYKHITTQLDIMTVEQMQAFIKNKNVDKPNKSKNAKFK